MPIIKSFAFTVFAESVTVPLVVDDELTARPSLSMVLLDGTPVETVKLTNQIASKTGLLVVPVKEVIPDGVLGQT